MLLSMTRPFRPCRPDLKIHMQAERPHIFVVDDDRAVLSLVGTSVSCLEVLRALRNVSPQCEAVLTTGYESVQAAVDAL